MPLVREILARFIEEQGHRVELAPVDESRGVTEILFRTRGQVFSVTTYEHDPGAYSISTAYEIPQWARERSQNAETLVGAHDEFPDVQFVMARDGAAFVAACDEDPGSPEAFTRSFWDIVSRLREAGNYAATRIVDRKQVKIAAEKFIDSLRRGER
jgi:hypothetical protein